MSSGFKSHAYDKFGLRFIAFCTSSGHRKYSSSRLNFCRIGNVDLRTTGVTGITRTVQSAYIFELYAREAGAPRKLIFFIIFSSQS